MGTSGEQDATEAIDATDVAQMRRELRSNDSDLVAQLTATQQQRREVEHQLLHILVVAGKLDTLTRRPQRIRSALRQVRFATQQIVLQDQIPAEGSTANLQLRTGSASPPQQPYQLKPQARHHRKGIQGVKRQLDRQAHCASGAVEHPPLQTILQQHAVDQQIDITLLVQRHQRRRLQQFAQSQEAALAIDRTKEREEPQTAVAVTVELCNQRPRDLTRQHVKWCCPDHGCQAICYGEGKNNGAGHARSLSIQRGQKLASGRRQPWQGRFGSTLVTCLSGGSHWHAQR